MYNGYGPGFGGGFMWIFGLLLILAIVWLVRSATGGSQPQPRVKSPREILDGRYARGEIDEADYRRRRKDIEN